MQDLQLPPTLGRTEGRTPEEDTRENTREKMREDTREDTRGEKHDKARTCSLATPGTVRNLKALATKSC